MTIKLGVVMDPIATITIKKDTTFAMLLAAQARGWQLHYFEQADLYALGNQSFGRTRVLSVEDNKSGWFAFREEREIPLAELDVILMRKDPPFDMEYIYTTYLLELAEGAGTLVVNKPRSLRDANEKFFALHFLSCCPPTLVSREPSRLKAFLGEHGGHCGEAAGWHGRCVGIPFAPARSECERDPGNPHRPRPAFSHGPALYSRSSCRRQAHPVN
jgi:glutathione synthase